MKPMSYGDSNVEFEKVQLTIVPSPYSKEILQILEGIYTENRIISNTIPKGKYMYMCRSSNGDDTIETVEPKVIVNFSGTIITDNPIMFPNQDDQCVYIGTITYL